MCSREDQVRLTDSYQYEDDQAGDEDAFAREPYILRVTCLSTGRSHSGRKAQTHISHIVWLYARVYLCMAVGSCIHVFVYMRVHI